MFNGPWSAHWKTVFGYLVAAGLYVSYVLLFDLCVCVLYNSLTVLATEQGDTFEPLWLLWTHSWFLIARQRVLCVFGGSRAFEACFLFGFDLRKNVIWVLYPLERLVFYHYLVSVFISSGIFPYDFIAYEYIQVCSFNSPHGTFSFSWIHYTHAISPEIRSILLYFDNLCYLIPSLNGHWEIIYTLSIYVGSISGGQGRGKTTCPFSHIQWTLCFRSDPDSGRLFLSCDLIKLYFLFEKLLTLSFVPCLPSLDNQIADISLSGVSHCLLQTGTDWHLLVSGKQTRALTQDSFLSSLAVLPRLLFFLCFCSSAERATLCLGKFGAPFS